MANCSIPLRARVKEAIYGLLIIRFQSLIKVTYQPTPFEAFPNRGKDGDQTAEDNIWSYQVAVPHEAPPGIYTLEFSVKDKEGHEIVVEEYADQAYGKSGVLQVEIQ